MPLGVLGARSSGMAGETAVAGFYAAEEGRDHRRQSWASSAARRRACAKTVDRRVRGVTGIFPAGRRKGPEPGGRKVMGGRRAGGGTSSAGRVDTAVQDGGGVRSALPPAAGLDIERAARSASRSWRIEDRRADEGSMTARGRRSKPLLPSDIQSAGSTRWWPGLPRGGNGALTEHHPHAPDDGQLCARRYGIAPALRRGGRARRTYVRGPRREGRMRRSPRK